MSRPPGWVVDRQFRLYTAALVLISLFMLMLPEGLSWASVGRHSIDASEGGNLLSKLQWFPFFGLAGLLLLLRFRLAMAMLPHLNPFLVAAMVWILASTLWSYDPDLTLRRAIKLLGAFLICWSVALASWDIGRFERLLRLGFLAFLLASLVFVVVNPTLGIHQADENEALLAGSWRGLASHKNSLGTLASVSLLFWAHAWMAGQQRRLALPALALSLLMLLAARSSTALLCGLLATGLMIAALRSDWVQRPGRLLLFGAAALLVPFLWLVILSGFPTLEQALGPLTRLLGRDLTFTGRVPLWQALLAEIPQRPVLGSGYLAFWGGPGTLSDAARAQAGWISSNGHNGYLDTANEIGLVGLGLVLAAIAYDLRRIRRLAAVSVGLFALHAALHLYQLVVNLSETMFWRPISLMFLLTTLSSFHLARLSLDLELRRRQAPSATDATPRFAHAHS